MLDQLRKCNPDLKLFSVLDAEFAPYGRVLDGYDFTEFLEVLAGKELPSEGNTYTGCDAEMMALPVVSALSSNFYAGMPIEAGFCNGQGNKLNALEYHRGSEIDIAGTELVLLLDRITSIVDNKMDSSSVVGFYVPAGCAVQLYETTLHFAPSRITDEGFRCGVVLPAHTNEPLEEKPAGISAEDELLWMRNKWLIAHKDSIPASRGAHVGISGKNIEVKHE
jgi:hypothetical protein